MNKNIVIDYNPDKSIEISGFDVSNIAAMITGLKAGQAKEFYKDEVDNVRFGYSALGHSSNPNRGKGELTLGIRPIYVGSVTVATIYCYGVPNEIKNDYH